ncbi:MAG: 16S rRNA (cytidine(1402)-2'-O)-methyltransferase [Oscillospiraceae bacterium]|jgi:16S rRNA (cytidine1402-2'-O)-methyltransferase|nr:16S rRNA (cytidine(1402)-2'-O)-methyltransferase [Oscillospiraceae bacterium]
MDNTTHEKQGKLYVVGTPIGNLGDFSPRGVQCLADCDFIAAEDTRVTGNLLRHFGVRKPQVSYHEHNRRESGESILRRLLAGEICALVTDAGMPAISDPGEDLVRACHAAGVPMESVPGPVAFATALALSGFPAGRFTFEGFLSVNRRSRKQQLDALEGETRTMLFYEAPHKLPATLQEFALRFGERPLAIVRELTKLHEEVICTTCAAAAERYGEGTLKGEMVLVLQGAPPPAPEQPQPLEAATALAEEYRRQGNSASEAAKRAAQATGRKKSEIYLRLTNDES